MIDSSAWLVLKDIRPSQNRYRFYSILIEKVVVWKPAFVVTMAWGRVDASKRKKVVVCSSEEELLKLLKQVLRIRLRHHYQLSDMNDQFPRLALLDSFPIAVVSNAQLSLF